MNHIAAPLIFLLSRRFLRDTLLTAFFLARRIEKIRLREKTPSA